MKHFVRNTFLHGLIGTISAIAMYETHEYVATYHQKYHALILPSYIIILSIFGILTGRIFRLFIWQLIIIRIYLLIGSNSPCPDLAGGILYVVLIE